MSLLSQIAIAFLALAIAGYLSKLLKSFKPPFYILVGIILGPAVLGWIEDHEIFSLLGDIGLIFLLFYLGYEFSLNKLVKKKKVLGLAGVIDFFINFSLAFVLGLLLNLSIFYTIVFAGMLYMSSSSIITKSLIQLGAIKKEEGEIVMGIMIFEDLIMIAFLVVIQSIVSNTGFEFWAVSKDIALAGAFALIVVYFGRKYSSLIDKLIGQQSHELAHLGFIAFIFAGVVIGVLFGVSEALSAFLLGLVVSEAKQKEKMEEVVIKFRDIFGSVFFLYFGMSFSFESLTMPIYILIIIVVVAIVGKLLSGLVMQLIQGCDMDGGLFVGIITIPRGEFSLIIAGIVAIEKPEFLNIAVVIILMTSFMTTIIFYILNKLCKEREVCVLSNQFLKNNE